MGTDAVPHVSWFDKLKSYAGEEHPLFDEVFLQRWGGQIWNPQEADKKAASILHTQISSRVATQAIGYQDGDEVSALESVSLLFDRARDAADNNFGARHFDVVVWHVLNTHVRPFTSRWHREAKLGALKALDSTDEFRADLKKLQTLLQCFDILLVDLRDDAPPPAAEPGQKDDSVQREVRTQLPFGIDVTFGKIHPEDAEAINLAEVAAIKARRKNYGLDMDAVCASGLAISGGGIRSATFALGILVSLGRRNLLPQFDYLSTVSGGGYLGSFLTTFLATKQLKVKEKKIGLKSSQQPFILDKGEAPALRYIRHRSKYLQTSLWERIKIAFAQAYGMASNILALLVVPSTIGWIEAGVRPVNGNPSPDSSKFFYLAVAAAVFALIIPSIVRFIPYLRRYADGLIALVSSIAVLLLAWNVLGYIHNGVASLGERAGGWLLFTSAAIPLTASALLSLLNQRHFRTKLVLTILAALAAPVLFLGIELYVYLWLTGTAYGPADLSNRYSVLGTLLLGLWIFGILLDINFTSPHRHYRRKLAETFLIQPKDDIPDNISFNADVSTKLSDLLISSCGSYPLMNCALNVPGSSNTTIQGRLTDFFLFSPAYCGSPLTRYQCTKTWERSNPNLNVGTAMAISGAAVSPVMGVNSDNRARFWLTLLNARLGYWLRKPNKLRLLPPNIFYLLKELRGSMNEKSGFINVTDGGHIENLGVYELLRRRCQFIVAIDGEQDPEMTFHGLANLQRLAAIDFGIRVEIDLDDLRLRETGLSRSHFRLCRIIYPGTGIPCGYLLYVKLSLTGNEGEFLRRHRLDEPVFPHHPTAHQNFSEVQFEAYRALGEHVGEKLFLDALVGDINKEQNVVLQDWFAALSRNLLRPII
ncbi:hypothetical protein [Methylorubrum sp. SL192]|uniref:hypothetical protein n=1 Tax=Methylorubrum sp. SL192 TaxID=2995167 RepID=UPI00227690C8|nr:hypothetical protein [Methylorubrum sp. SL192]MCY1644067.1 hypothetical protein [Methylorubrum sp. SL192]